MPIIDPGSVQLSVETFADFLLKYFVALAAVGALAMALIELWKKVRNSQMRYHACMVTAWLKRQEITCSVTPRSWNWCRRRTRTGNGK